MESSSQSCLTSSRLESFARWCSPRERIWWEETGSEQTGFEKFS